MTFSIGRLSKSTGVNIETIRYYEREGLIDEPGRTLGGHRQYGIDAVHRLRFVRRARELGFSLPEVRQMLSFSNGSQRCEEIRELAEGHLSEVRNKIRDLKRLQRSLKALTEACHSTPSEVCPIFDALSFGAEDG